MGKLILASRSPRRKDLLSMITEDFSVLPSQFNEEIFAESDPFLLVRVLSLSKASTITAQAQDVVIGCDTVVCFENEVFGIPKDFDEAKMMLSRLSGKTHSVISGVCVLENNNIHQFECETKVTFFELSEKQIENYLNTQEPYDKAGGYAIQGGGGLFVKEIHGDYQNVVGLPISRLYNLLTSIEKIEDTINFKN